MSLARLYAPWTDDQVSALNRWQHFPLVHPFTCGRCDCKEPLIARTSGWYCQSCGGEQKWALALMAEPAVNQEPAGRE